MGEPSALTELVEKGRRRTVTQLLIKHVSLALAIAFGGALALILFGTQILDWYWLLILFAAGFAYSAWRSHARIPAAYQVAQSMDRELGLKDSVSTAFYFSEHPQGDPVTMERQRAMAEELARQADVRNALPFKASRSLYACAGLAAAVLGFVAIRYGVTHSLDMRSALVRIPFQDFLARADQIADAKKKPSGQKPGDENKQPSNAVDPEQVMPPDTDPASEEALKVIDTPEVNNPDQGYDAAKAQAAKDKSKDPQQDPGDSSASSEPKPGNEAPEGASQDQNGGSQGKNKQDKEAKSGNQQNNSGENSSLADKMKDALSNLMSKLKTPSKSGDGKQSEKNAQNGQQPGKQNGGKDQNAQAESKQQGEASSNPDAQGDQQQSADQAQSAQGQSNGKDSQHASSPDSKSGVGKQDGDKSLREAEQLAAMGKISELIGKRAQNVSGEMMVEVSSGKQQLKTQYSNRSASHAEAGGDINRDEVPLAYQQYVQRYFEEIRKVPQTKAKSDSPLK